MGYEIKHYLPRYHCSDVPSKYNWSTAQGAVLGKLELPSEWDQLSTEALFDLSRW